MHVTRARVGEPARGRPAWLTTGWGELAEMDGWISQLATTQVQVPARRRPDHGCSSSGSGSGEAGRPVQEQVTRPWPPLQRPAPLLP